MYRTDLRPDVPVALWCNAIRKPRHPASGLGGGRAGWCGWFVVRGHRASTTRLRHPVLSQVGIQLQTPNGVGEPKLSGRYTGGGLLGGRSLENPEEFVGHIDGRPKLVRRDGLCVRDVISRQPYKSKFLVKKSSATALRVQKSRGSGANRFWDHACAASVRVLRHAGGLFMPVAMESLCAASGKARAHDFVKERPSSVAVHQSRFSNGEWRLVSDCP